MTPTFVPADGVLHEPRRNRFFYGKLMDVEHFEQEQAYFRSRQALVNNATGYRRQVATQGASFTLASVSLSRDRSTARKIR